MATNNYQPHLLVLPEDDANRQIANGFTLAPTLNARMIQVLNPAGGWLKVVNNFRDNHVQDMNRWPERRILLIIDMDDTEKRLEDVKNSVPTELQNRVFVLGVLSEPEKLRAALNANFESIGKSLARDCSANTQIVWHHPLLKHNEKELARMTKSVKPFLFS